MKVLFIGNSHTFFNDMPALFASMCEELTKEKPEVTMLSYGGRSLKWHYDEFFSVRFALEYGRYDYCVIQQQAHPFPGEEETAPYMEKLCAMCRAAGTEPVIYMTWAEKAKPGNEAPMSALYRKLAEKENALLAPVGEIFGRLNREHPEIDLYFRDGEHASPYGDYLIAACFAGLLTGKGSLSGLSDRAIDFKISFDAETKSMVPPCGAEEAKTVLDSEKTQIIRTAVEEALGALDR